MDGSLRILSVFAVILLTAFPFLGSDAVTIEAPRARLRWNKDRIRVALSSSLTSANSNIKTDSDVLGAVERSLRKWQEVTSIEFELVRTDRFAISPGTSGDGVSIITIAPTADNLLIFTKELSNASATTRVFFDRRSGQIREADIVLNPARQFSTDHTFGTLDLEKVLTHEIGHLLGLEHSPMFSSVMYDEVPRNGFVAFESTDRALSSDDISKARALYGPGISDADCCVTIRGELRGITREKGLSAIVWAEDRLTGSAVQTVRGNADGSFVFEGLESGDYAIFAQARKNDGRSFSTEFIGETQAKVGNDKFLFSRSKTEPAPFDITISGINGQLSNGPIRVERGRNYRLLLGGKALNEKGLLFSFSSPLLVVGSAPTVMSDFDTGHPVIGVDVLISDSIEPGQYSVIVESSSGIRRVLVGAIIVN